MRGRCVSGHVARRKVRVDNKKERRQESLPPFLHLDDYRSISSGGRRQRTFASKREVIQAVASWSEEESTSFCWWKLILNASLPDLLHHTLLNHKR